MPPPTLMPNGDVVVSPTASYKCRTEYIHINNSNPGQLTVQLVESLRGVNANGDVADTTAVTKVRSYTPEDLASIEIDGLTFAQVFTWIHKWAAGVNFQDAEELATKLMPPVAP